MQTNWVCQSEALRFCKKWLSRVIDCDSSQSYQKSWLESSHWLESRYYWKLVTRSIASSFFLFASWRSNVFIIYSKRQSSISNKFYDKNQPLQKRFAIMFGLVDLTG